MIPTYSEIAGKDDDINSLAALSEKDLSRVITVKKLENIEKIKKNHFYCNAGLIKFSTCHSFKGLECKTVFYLMLKEDSPELIYTTITRSSENLVIFDIGSDNECSAFLQETL